MEVNKTTSIFEYKPKLLENKNVRIRLKKIKFGEIFVNLFR